MTDEHAGVRKPLIERVRERKERHKERGTIYRVSFAVAGVGVIILGVILLPLPGPGWLIIALGLAMLALEFDRAERLLMVVLDRLERVGDRAAQAGPLGKALGIVLFVLGAAGAVTAMILWELPYLPG